MPPKRARRGRGVISDIAGSLPFPFNLIGTATKVIGLGKRRRRPRRGGMSIAIPKVMRRGVYY